MDDETQGWNAELKAKQHRNSPNLGRKWLRDTDVTKLGKREINKKDNDKGGNRLTYTNTNPLLETTYSIKDKSHTPEAMPMKTQGSINGVKAITTTEKKRRRDEDVIEMKEVDMGS